MVIEAEALIQCEIIYVYIFARLTLGIKEKNKRALYDLQPLVAPVVLIQRLAQSRP